MESPGAVLSFVTSNFGKVTSNENNKATDVDCNLMYDMNNHFVEEWKSLKLSTIRKFYE